MEKFFYRAEKGDTVSSLSMRFNVPACCIIKQNNLRKEIAEGDILYVERSNQRQYRVKPFDTLSALAEKFCTTEEKILTDNGIKYIYYGLNILV